MSLQTVKEQSWARIRSRTLLPSVGLLFIGTVFAQVSAQADPRGESVQASSFYRIYAVPAVTNQRFLPFSPPEGASVVESIEVTAARDEYEPASFAVYALQPLKKVKVTVTMLEPSGKPTRAATARSPSVDVRVVKCWYQSGGQRANPRNRLLKPELLLNDDDLVRVDYEKQENFLKLVNESGRAEYVPISTRRSDHLTAILPRDSDTLQPVDIPAGTLKQFWLTVHVPADTAPGEYRATARVQPDNAPAAELSLRVTVLPFTLEEPLLRYSLFYRGVLTADGKGSIGSEAKSAQQYLAEMRNLKAHGVDYPTIYQGSRYSDVPVEQRIFDPGLIKQALQFREKAGMPKDTLYTLGVVCGTGSTPNELGVLKRRVKAWIDLAEENGWGQVYVYAIDEASDETLLRERAAFAAVHQAGGKVFVACGTQSFWKHVGDLLDLPVLQHPAPTAPLLEKIRVAGHKLWNYGTPQVHVEQPETYRRNYGFGLWKAGFDGSATYAYQHTFGKNIWNDFDSPGPHRDHVFAYPTVDGVIDTIQWEGFREGADDVRYLTTLLRAIEKARGDGRKQQLVKEAEHWLASLRAGYDVGGDLNALRRQVIHFTLELIQKSSGRKTVVPAPVMSIQTEQRAQAGQAGRSYPCYRLSKQPLLDGRVKEDPAWHNIPPATGFFVLHGDYAQTKQTVVKCAWNDENLFIAMECQEPDINAAQARPREDAPLAAYEEDSVEIFLFPMEAKDYFQFAVNMKGARWNGIGMGGGYPPGDWTTATFKGDDFWSVEVMLPFKVFNRIPEEGEVWLGNFCRNIYVYISGGDKYTSWAKTELGFHEPHNFGEILFKTEILSLDEVEIVTETINSNYLEVEQHDK